MKMKPLSHTVAELLELRRNDMLTVNSEYQRGQVWSQAQQKRLVDSILRAYPIPLMYLHHVRKEVAGFKSNKLEIIDGQQRINALYYFSEGAFKLFDPVKDEAAARFPTFIRNIPCSWGGKDFDSLDEADRQRFLETTLSVVRVETDDQNEARDLFIRLQAGMPLNAQEKRDAWPGKFTEFVLKVAGKPEILRYQGHDFFKVLMGAQAGKGRGKFRQLAAQMYMLFFIRRQPNGDGLCTISGKAVDNFYYQHLDLDTSSHEARRFVDILDMLTRLLDDKKRKKLVGYEAIDLMLLVDTLLDDYTRSWEAKLAEGFEQFRFDLAKDKKEKEGEFWLRYGTLTRTASDKAETIQRRHQFFCEQMYGRLALQLKDPRRNYDPLEREIIYYRDKKKCLVCGAEVIWSEADIHHVDPHIEGGLTTLENGVLVHRHCHPKGQAAVEFAQKFKDCAVQESEAAELPGQILRDTNAFPPDGTLCLFRYKNDEFRGEIRNGQIVVEDYGGFASFSAASRAITDTSRNGWSDWKLKLPNKSDWILADTWRESI